MAEYIDIYDADRNLTGETVERAGAFLREGQFMLYALAIIEDAQGRYLITQRSLDKHWAAGSWEVSGGGVLSGETSYQAIVREVGEEVGLDVSAIDAQPVFSYDNVDLDRGDNYIVDIYHFTLDFDRADVRLQESEAIAFDLVSWDDITALEGQGKFLHYRRIQQALEAQGVL